MKKHFKTNYLILALFLIAVTAFLPSTAVSATSRYVDNSAIPSMRVPALKGDIPKLDENSTPTINNGGDNTGNGQVVFEGNFVLNSDGSVSPGSNEQKDNTPRTADNNIMPYLFVAGVMMFGFAALVISKSNAGLIKVNQAKANLKKDDFLSQDPKPAKTFKNNREYIEDILGRK